MHVRPAWSYSPILRGVEALAMALSRGSLLLLAALITGFPEFATPSRLLRLAALFFALPAVAAWLVRRACTASLSLEGEAVVVQRRSRRVEVPLASIEALRPWAIPLPRGGFWLRLVPGAGPRLGIAVDDPVGWAEDLALAGVGERALDAARHPHARYARSRSAARSRWDHPLLKYVAFSLVPTLPLFRLHQFIAYGGTFGEYYQHGLRAYLLGFGLHWLLFAIHLLAYGAVLRAATEMASVAAAWFAPAHEQRVRRVAEIAQRTLYYGGVPTLLALRLLPG